MVQGQTIVLYKRQMEFERINQKSKTPDLFIWVFKGQSQHHISCLQFQLITVSGSVIMYCFYLEKKIKVFIVHELFKPVDVTAFHKLMEDEDKVVKPCRGILVGVRHRRHWSPHSVPRNNQKRFWCIKQLCHRNLVGSLQDL